MQRRCLVLLVLLAGCGGAAFQSSDAGRSSGADGGGAIDAAGPPQRDGAADAGDQDASAAPDGPSPSTDGGGGEASASDASTDGGADCPAALGSVVYLLSSQNELYTFAPAQKLVTKVGAVQCATSLLPAGGSMAVDRAGGIFIDYSDSMGTSGAVFRVSAKDASCGAHPVTMLPSGWAGAPLAYATSGTKQSLFIAAMNGSGLGVLDLLHGTASSIGPFTGTLAGVSTQLSGTGDGRLFGLFATSPLSAAAINEGTGATGAPVSFPETATAITWTFAFWAGHLYLFTSQGPDSTVADYDLATGSVNAAYLADLGFVAALAGVSTCAPTM